MVFFVLKGLEHNISAQRLSLRLKSLDSLPQYGRHFVG